MKTKLTILTILITLASLYAVGEIYSEINDKSDQFSQDQSYTFSPGYINASKQKTDAIIRQLSKQKNPIEQSSESMDNKLSNNVAGDVNNAVLPELKHKTSGTGESSANPTAGVTTTIEIPTPENKSVETPAYMRNTILEYVTTNSPTCISYDIRYSAGNYYAVWNSGNSIQAQVFGASGNVLHATPLTLAASSGNVSNISTFENGNVAIFWSEGSASIGFSYKAQLFNSLGDKIYASPVSLTGNRILTGSYFENVTLLKNGNMAVFWDEKDSNSKYTLKAQILNSSGDMLFANPFSLTEDRSSGGVGSIKLSMLNNGNYMLFWNEINASNKYSVYSQIFDSSANMFAAKSVDLTNGKVLNSAGVYNVSNFSNGNVIVNWSERNTSNIYSLNAQIYDSGGNKVYNTPISLTGDRLLKNASINKISTLSNGNVEVFWSEMDSSLNYSLRAQVFDPSGSTLYNTPISLTGDRSLTSVWINEVTNFGNGNVAVFWRETYGLWKDALKAQVFDSSGNALYDSQITLTGDRLSNIINMNSIIKLENGSIAVFWNENVGGYKSIRAQIFDSSGKLLSAMPIDLTGGRALGSADIGNITVFDNDNIAVFWTEGGIWNAVTGSTNLSLKAQVFDSSGKSLYTAPLNLTGDSLKQTAKINKVIKLENGDIAVLWDSSERRGINSITTLKAQIFDSSGKTLYDSPVTLTGDRNAIISRVNTASMLKDGNIAIFWDERNKDNSYSLKSQVIGSAGNFLSVDAMKLSTQFTNINNIDRGMLLSPYLYSFKAESLESLSRSIFEKGAIIGNADVSNIFKGLLANRGALMYGDAFAAGGAIVAGVVKNVLGVSALAVPAGTINREEIMIASVLANILKNPTDEQRLIIDAVQALLTVIENAASPELQKASDDMLQMVAAALIAQSIPDLFKEGDMSYIKNLFSELNTEKSRIILEYRDSTKPYYDAVVKELSKNMESLQIGNILSGNMSKEQLEKLPRNEIDKILEKLRQAKDRSFEGEYILQQEVKHRKSYIDPNKKAFEDKMKGTIGSFTKKLSGVLEGAGSK